jgi:hypothetical protein
MKLKNVTYLRKGGALDILDGLELFGELLADVERHGFLLVLGQLLDHGRIVAQVDLRSHQQEGRLVAVMRYFRNPLKKKKHSVVFPREGSRTSISSHHLLCFVWGK